MEFPPAVKMEGASSLFFFLRKQSDASTASYTHTDSVPFKFHFLLKRPIGFFLFFPSFFAPEQSPTFCLQPFKRRGNRCARDFCSFCTFRLVLFAKRGDTVLWEGIRVLVLRRWMQKPVRKVFRNLRPTTTRRRRGMLL